MAFHRSPNDRSEYRNEPTEYRNEPTEKSPQQLCRQHFACDVCSIEPGCAWCGSSATCIPLAHELKKNKSAVVYNGEEYARTYGRPADDNETSLSRDCILWIIEPASCTSIADTCRIQNSCHSCLQTFGCGFCRNSESCMPGFGRTPVGLYSGDNPCRRDSGSWIVGNWPDLAKGDSFSLQRCNYSFSFGSTDYNADPVGAGLPAHYFVFIVVFACIAFLCFARLFTRLFPQANLVPSQIAIRATASVQPLDIHKLEALMPACRAVLIGRRKNKRDSEQEIEESSDGLCSVCLCTLSEGEEARQLPCQHLFHKHCIDEWLRKSGKCPVCRQDIEEMAKDCSKMENVNEESSVPVEIATI